jgi:hypothetical protein
MHAIASALADDDLDLALELGLLDAAPCEHCSGACNARLATARDARLAALAARERYRLRQARLQRRAQQRAPARVASTPTATNTAEANPALPTAAAAALARAKERAAERRKP